MEDNKDLKPVKSGDAKKASPSPADAGAEKVTLEKAYLDALEQRARSAEGRLARIEKDRAEAEKSALEEQGKWKELAETTEQKLANLQNELFAEKLNSAVVNAAQKAGAVNPGAVLKMLSGAEVKRDEKGNVLNAEDLVNSVKTEVPQLFGEALKKVDLPDKSSASESVSDLASLQAQLEEETAKPGPQQDATKVSRLIKQIAVARRKSA